jgi:hypothetical protein
MHKKLLALLAAVGLLAGVTGCPSDTKKESKPIPKEGYNKKMEEMRKAAEEKGKEAMKKEAEEKKEDKKGP